MGGDRPPQGALPAEGRRVVTRFNILDPSVRRRFRLNGAQCIGCMEHIPECALDTARRIGREGSEYPGAPICAACALRDDRKAGRVPVFPSSAVTP